MKALKIGSIILLTTFLLPSRGYSEMSFKQRLQNSKLLSSSSEFSISYPNESAPKGRVLLAKARKGKIFLEKRSKRTILKSTDIDFATYRGLFERLEEILGAPDRSEDSHACMEPFVVRVQIGSWVDEAEGCRGSSSMATSVSRLARDMEFLLIQSTSI